MPPRYLRARYFFDRAHKRVKLFELLLVLGYMALPKDFNELLRHCTTGETCAALLAKLHLIAQDRESQIKTACVRIQNAAAATGVLGSSGAGAKLWDAGRRACEQAADSATDAAFSVGLDAGQAAQHIGAEARAFMLEFAGKWLEPYGEVATECKREALTMATRISRTVVARGFDLKQAKEKERSAMMTINVSGGNVQVGDGNQQTITYQALLSNLAAAVESSADAPPEKKVAWATALRELAAHPLTQSLITAAASVAAGK
jgi:hypothetical protein